MARYIVQQGDHISKIAADHGLRLWQTIWDHPDNADLKAKRGNPNVLFPGDELEVPERESRTEECATGRRHRFRAKTQGLTLRVKTLDFGSAPVTNADATLWVGGDFEHTKTDGEGMLERALPLNAQEGRLRVQSPAIAGTLDVPLDIGHLDPVDQVTGQIARLNNLGYDAGPVEEPEDSAAKQRVCSAVEEFQCDQGLKVDGIVGPNTQKKLKEAHGC